MDQLDEATAAALVDKTIAAGRSIGTLNLAMRELGAADPALRDRLEQAIGAGRFLRLIAANGTVFELFMILKHTTAAFRKALLDQLDEATAAALVDKTIAVGRSIGTLPLAMREMGAADPALRDRLEQAIGAGRFLHLIAANGTLFELFNILEYSTATFREVLLDKLDEATAAGLVNKTIAAERSIESLYFTLRQLAHTPTYRERLEQLVGIDGWWRLVIGAGSLNSLSQIIHAMSDDFRRGFIAASSTLVGDQWERIIMRGLFLNACTFAAADLAAYPPTSQSAFREALDHTAASLAAKASWFDLNPSRPPTDSGSAEGRILREAIQARARAIMLDDLLGMDFCEAVNGLAFSWRERPDLRAALAVRIWDILPDPAEWPREKGEIAILRFVLVISRSETVSADDAQRLMTTVGSFLDREVCDDTHTLPLFLLLWNVATLRYERGANRSFDGTLPDALIETLLGVLRGRVRPKGPNKEKLAQLALAGLLGFLAPSLCPKLHHILAPLTKSALWLHQQALEQTFVPALFALEGLALLHLSEAVFTPVLCIRLLGKSEEYEDVGAAIEHLRERVRRYDKP